jgi:Tfp pilus assembly protein PilV
MQLSVLGNKTTTAFTLVEILISLVIMGMSVGGIVYGYTLACRQAEWTSYSLSAQSLAIQQMEQTRAASWDPYRSVPIDELVPGNFPIYFTNLDIPQVGTNNAYCTNIITITTNSAKPYVKIIKVDSIWSFRWSYKRTSLFTNTIMTYRAPDQ